MTTEIIAFLEFLAIIFFVWRDINRSRSAAQFKYLKRGIEQRLRNLERSRSGKAA